MTVIYKYPLASHQCTITVPYRCHVLSVQHDPAGQLCVWALHDIQPELYKKYEFLVIGTGWDIDEPLTEMPTENATAGTIPFSYVQTVVERDFVWHIFMRELFE